MSFKIKGGRVVVHSKWALSDDEKEWNSVGNDCNGGQLIQRVHKRDTGTWLASFVHLGHVKFSAEIVELESLEKVCKNLDSAKGWCRKMANGRAFRHDRDIELTPDDFRFLSHQTTPGSIAPGDIEDFGPNQRPTQKFRTKRRRK
jgi:hypothetical protein